MAVAVWALWLLSPQSAGAIDLHAFWDGRCASCHGHAGQFARTYLRVESGTLVGRHPNRDLKRFLAQHEMGPTYAAAIHAMLLAQARTPPVYQQRCASCHKTAAEFVRGSLERKDGIIVGRSSQQPLSRFLQRHGGLQPQEASIVVESLTRIFEEVHGAPTR
ncbi:MAG: hypothetical protein IT538_12180 [Variibacter sp.]|nr:hypothetical protein [Variibacter sp.]